ncbi:glucose 1-dehydrogenase [Actinoallomurus sp. NPDC052308]|uniref:glucose 1-dehydrogenase n=1 Tax=Actinoallomurus sp. NPDC052308 TaxID=3155530 RepID=UPI00343D1994
MRALTTVPLKAGSLQVSEVPEPMRGEGELLVEGVALGVCGTDREIVSGDYGYAPPGDEHLIIGHESLGRVMEAPEGGDFRPGDLVVGIVRRPDPVPCGACAHGEFDMCRNGRYTERGIKQRHGFGSERWTIETDYAVRIDPALGDLGVLLEPTTVVAKAWDHLERIGARAWFEPRRVLVAGAGPIGLLAALLGAQRGLDVHVLDRVTGGVKPKIVAKLGGTYHTGSVAEVAAKTRPDIVIEATGVAQLVMEAIAESAASVVCLTGVSRAGHRTEVDAGGVNRQIVLSNAAVFGSVNANHRHYRLAAEALGRADRSWLAQLITNRLPLDRAPEALRAGSDDDVKVVIDL